MTVFKYYACVTGIHLDAQEVENVMESAKGEWIGFNRTSHRNEDIRASIFFTDKDDMMLAALCLGIDYSLPEEFCLIPFEFHEPINKFYDVE